MEKIKNLKDLGLYGAKCIEKLCIRAKSSENNESCKENDKIEVLVCGGTGCRASQSQEIIQKFESVVEKGGLSDRVSVVQTGCFGFCEKGQREVMLIVI